MTMLVYLAMLCYVYSRYAGYVKANIMLTNVHDS